jgi:hypothetical protein
VGALVSLVGGGDGDVHGRQRPVRAEMGQRTQLWTDSVDRPAC